MDIKHGIQETSGDLMMLKIVISLLALTFVMSALLSADAHSSDGSAGIGDGFVELQNSSVSLAGSSYESVVPDRAGVTVVVKSCDKDSRYDAVTANAETVQALKAELESSGDVESIATEAYYVTEQRKYDYDYWGEYRDFGVECYDITHKLRLNSHDPDSLGGLIDIAMKNGAEDVENMGFGLSSSKKSELSKRLSREALEDADENLVNMFPAAENAILEKVSISISYGSWNFYPGYTIGAAGYRYDEMDEITEIDVPEIDVIATAKAVYIVS
jgi:uncharacterized protein YggE